MPELFGRVRHRLGLSMVQEIERRSGGTIELSSSPGPGATFRILLSLAAVG